MIVGVSIAGDGHTVKLGFVSYTNVHSYKFHKHKTHLVVSRRRRLSLFPFWGFLILVCVPSGGNYNNVVIIMGIVV